MRCRDALSTSESSRREQSLTVTHRMADGDASDGWRWRIGWLTVTHQMAVSTLLARGSSRAPTEWYGWFQHPAILTCRMCNIRNRIPIESSRKHFLKNISSERIVSKTLFKEYSQRKDLSQECVRSTLLERFSRQLSSRSSEESAPRYPHYKITRVCLKMTYTQLHLPQQWDR